MRLAWVTQSDIVPIRTLLKELDNHLETKLIVVGCRVIRGIYFPDEKKLADELTAYKPDIIVSDEPYQIATSIVRSYCRVHNIPYIVTVRRNNTTGLAEKAYFTASTPTMRRNIAEASKVVSISSRGATWLEGYCDYHTLLKNKVSAIPNGVKMSDFDVKPHYRDVFRKVYGFSDTDKVILNVCRDHPDKRLDLTQQIYWRVWQEIPDAKLFLCGKGVGKYYKEGSIYTNESVNHDTMVSVYAGSDIVISTSRREPFGVALVEALACHKPVIAFDIGGHNDIIDPWGTVGELIPYPNVDGFATQIIRRLKEPKDIGVGADDRIKQFDIENVAQKWMEVIKCSKPRLNNYV